PPRPRRSLCTYTTLFRSPVSIRKLDNHRWQCEPCEGPLSVQYQVYAWDLSVRGAHIDQTHAFFNGTSALLAVEGQTEQPCLLERSEEHTSELQSRENLVC